MDFYVTMLAGCVGVALVCYVNVVERRRLRNWKPGRLSTTPLMFLGAIVVLVSVARLLVGFGR